MEDNTQTIQTDVNTQPDTTTGGGSSPTDQAPVAATTQDNSTQATGDKTVPYDRFAEVNHSLRQTQAELRAMREQQEQLNQNFVKQNQPAVPAEVQAAKQQLVGLLKEVAPELGFVSKQEIEQQRQIQEVETTLSNLESKYNGKDGLPKFNRQEVIDYATQMGITTAKGLEIAYKQMHEAEIMDARLQKALQQSRGIKTETSNGTGSANAGVTNQDLEKAAQEGDQSAVLTLLRRARKA